MTPRGATPRGAAPGAASMGTAVPAPPVKIQGGDHDDGLSEVSFDLGRLGRAVEAQVTSTPRLGQTPRGAAAPRSASSGPSMAAAAPPASRHMGDEDPSEVGVEAGRVGRAAETTGRWQGGAPSGPIQPAHGGNDDASEVSLDLGRLEKAVGVRQDQLGTPRIPSKSPRRPQPAGRITSRIGGDVGGDELEDDEESEVRFDISRLGQAVAQQACTPRTPRLPAQAYAPASTPLVSASFAPPPRTQAAPSAPAPGAAPAFFSMYQEDGGDAPFFAPPPES